MKKEELIDAARICTGEKNCMGCPMLPKFQSGEYCIDRLITGLVDELENKDIDKSCRNYGKEENDVTV